MDREDERLLHAALEQSALEVLLEQTAACCSGRRGRKKHEKALKAACKKGRLVAAIFDLKRARPPASRARIGGFVVIPASARPAPGHVSRLDEIH